jgi:hypothetical protein
MAPSLKKVLDWLFLGVKLSTGCCCPSFSISQSLEHVHVVAGISWIRVMCWNPREPRPLPHFNLTHYIINTVQGKLQLK